MQVIPTQNKPALIGFLIAVFSLIPCLAFILGPIAVVLGVLGLNKVKENPEVSGTAHALIGIGLGGLTFVANAFVLAKYLQNGSGIFS